MWLQLIFSNLEVRFFPLSEGVENEGLGGVCESELEIHLPASEISLAPN